MRPTPRGSGGTGGDARCRNCELNAAHLGCAGPTNILSFPAAPEESGLGVLAFGLETWLREAALYGQKPELHAQRLLAHGLAHLLGHDHGPKWMLAVFFCWEADFLFQKDSMA